MDYWGYGSGFFIGWAAGSWGTSWGDDVEVHEEIYYGGGRRSSRQHEDDLHRAHWDYIEALNEIRAEVKSPASGTTKLIISGDVPLPEAVKGRAMRGKVRTVKDILDDPTAMFMLLALVAEAIDD